MNLHVVALICAVSFPSLFLGEFCLGTELSIKVVIVSSEEFILKDREDDVKEAVLLTSRLVSLRKPHHQDDGTFRLPREMTSCATVFTDGPNAGKCAGISNNYRGDFCGEVEIPVEYLGGVKVYDYNNTRCLKESLPRGKGFQDGTNFVLFLTAGLSELCRSSLAYSSTCRMESALIGGVISGRPIAGIITLCENRLKDLRGLLLKRVIVHEVVHLLGFNYRSILEFIDCDYPDLESQSESQVTNLNSNILCWKRRDVLQVVRRNEVILKSSSLLDAVRQIENSSFEDAVCSFPEREHFNYSDSNGNVSDNSSRSILSDLNYTSAFEFGKISNILNEYDGVTLAKTQTGLHWPRELFSERMVSVMVPELRNSEMVVFDPLTVAILETSGWYSINKSAVKCLNCFMNNESLPHNCLIYNETNVDLMRNKTQSFDTGESECSQLSSVTPNIVTEDTLDEIFNVSLFDDAYYPTTTEKLVNVEKGNKKNIKVRVPDKKYGDKTNMNPSLDSVEKYTKDIKSEVPRICPTIYMFFSQTLLVLWFVMLDYRVRLSDVVMHQ